MDSHDRKLNNPLTGLANKAIILDLDDTIFQTRSMDKKVFQPFFDHLILSLQPTFSKQTIDHIVNELWQNTWDKVIDQHKIPVETIMDSIRVLENLELNLNISPYPDYTFIRDLPHSKFLVTTSLTSLQNSKIRALGIENDFTEIIINDTFKESKNKLDIFKELIIKYNLVAEDTYVVGDNANSEIAAGNKLNMITVQVLREGVIKGTNAKHYINSFVELENILS